MGTRNLREYRLAVTGNGYKGNEGQRQETDIQNDPRSSSSYATTGKIWVQRHYHMPGMQMRGRDHNAHVTMSNSHQPRMNTGSSNCTQKRGGRKKSKSVDVIWNQDAGGRERNQHGGPHGGGEERFLRLRENRMDSTSKGKNQRGLGSGD